MSYMMLEHRFATIHAASLHHIMSNRTRFILGKISGQLQSTTTTALAHNLPRFHPRRVSAIHLIASQKKII
ncbi:hypothetical protein M413DRAFT_246180 [Hebeloma cylindrosporum]|uniref:Uncharacterized protein n=1 Tax=Hebeloma cylindrosporum TaxID=76867 RepID=A0A0C2XKZ5_HEBCY|nr:hypothetical protein M413DRAFT_246180 [Hebeloma cylindrosporum h7]